MRHGLAVRSHLKSGEIDPNTCSDYYQQYNLWHTKVRDCKDCYRVDDTLHWIPDTFCTAWRNV